MRTNALFTVCIGGLSGEGEVGLPPKKVNVYLSDLDDVIAFTDAFKEKVSACPSASSLQCLTECTS